MDKDEFNFRVRTYASHADFERSKQLVDSVMPGHRESYLNLLAVGFNMNRSFQLLEEVKKN